MEGPVHSDNVEDLTYRMHAVEAAGAPLLPVSDVVDVAALRVPRLPSRDLRVLRRQPQPHRAARQDHTLRHLRVVRTAAGHAASGAPATIATLVLHENVSPACPILQQLLSREDYVAEQEVGTDRKVIRSYPHIQAQVHCRSGCGIKLYHA